VSHPARDPALESPFGFFRRRFCRSEPVAWRDLEVDRISHSSRWFCRSIELARGRDAAGASLSSGVCTPPRSSTVSQTGLRSRSYVRDVLRLKGIEDSGDRRPSATGGTPAGIVHELETGMAIRNCMSRIASHSAERLADGVNGRSCRCGVLVSSRGVVAFGSISAFS